MLTELAIYIGVIAAATGVVWTGSDWLESSSVSLAAHYRLPPVVQGGIIAAVGSSFPELSSTVLASNIFDLLIAVPLGVLIAGSANVRYDVAAPMMAVLTLATIVLFSMLRTRMRLSPGESVVLLILYGVFIVWIGLETVGVTSLVR